MKRAETNVTKPGPDPVIGVGLFVVGLLVMATGGAFTWHYVFNVGEGILLLGAIVFLANTAITSLRIDPVDWRAVARTIIGKAEASGESERGPKSK